MLAIFTIFTLMFTAQNVAGMPSKTSVFARQSASSCSNACIALQDISNASTDDSVLCSSQGASDYAACLDCNVAMGALTQANAQDEMDAYASTCKSEGFAVNSQKISKSAGTRLRTAPAALLTLFSVAVVLNSC
ncbi:hypothetical protein B0H17DRAFT_1212913 [Mycena rosella]|uniref:Uncharacterized protein n=1 Tax=Mycena rosella TaxID=1033263 RepID=A0AAD7G5S5_MYCRO|nr:hypothetical protein B0H17DRAFT_1212913 [Mycena rosella]